MKTVGQKKMAINNESYKCGIELGYFNDSGNIMGYYGSLCGIDLGLSQHHTDNYGKELGYCPADI
ncbi:MAG: hypothetical protein ACYDCJ_10480 [Gammaproteobacteria bacterium]